MRRRGRGARAGRGIRAVLTLLGAAGVGAVPRPGGTAAAQVELDVVDSLAAAGRTDEARERLVGWWEGAADGAARHEIQRALWLRGRLTTDGGDAERAYQRLVVEFPGGPYSARALLRLGQLAHARGDLPGAAERFRTVVRDYADTPQRLEALRWLERHGGRAEEMAALAPSTPPPPSSAAEPSPPPEPGASRVETATFAVQIGAFSREEGARALAARAEEQGLAARLVRVPGSELIRVRVGRFGGVEDARTTEARLRHLGFETAVVSDVPAELPIR